MEVSGELRRVVETRITSQIGGHKGNAGRGNDESVPCILIGIVGTVVIGALRNVA